MCASLFWFTPAISEKAELAMNEGIPKKNWKTSHNSIPACYSLVVKDKPKAIGCHWQVVLQWLLAMLPLDHVSGFRIHKQKSVIAIKEEKDQETWEFCEFVKFKIFCVWKKIKFTFSHILSMSLSNSFRSTSSSCFSVMVNSWPVAVGQDRKERAKSGATTSHLSTSLGQLQKFKSPLLKP